MLLLLLLGERGHCGQHRSGRGNLRGRPVVPRGQECGGGRSRLMLLHGGGLRRHGSPRPRRHCRGVEQGGRGGRGARPRRGCRRIVVAAMDKDGQIIIPLSVRYCK